MTNVQECDVAVIGAGFAGIYAVHKFRDQLGLSVTGIDAAGGVGGTWWWNRYPGARCDIPSVHYSYSFSDDIQENWRWSEKYATQPEILAYLQYVAQRLDVAKEFTFDARVTSTVWNDEESRWLLTTDTGRQITARFVVAAGGNLSVPKNTVEFPGLDQFAGELYFTSRWPDADIDFAGKRVGVVGTGSTGIQIVQTVGKVAGHLTVFQRTPNFATPLRNESIEPERQKWMAENHEEVRRGSRETVSGVPMGDPLPSSYAVSDDERRERYEEMYQRGGFALLSASFADILFDQGANDLMADFVREKIRGRIDDPAVAELLVPTDHPFGTKRPPLEMTYYDTFNQDNVDLVSIKNRPIDAITATGVKVGDDNYRLDVLIMATGFDAGTGALTGLGIRGQNGLSLDEHWTNGPRTYLGIAVSGFPNLFTITGPTSAVALYNNPLAIEDHVDLAAALIGEVLGSGHRTVRPSVDSEKRWYALADGLLQQSLFPKANSWYMGDNVPGKPRATGIFVGTAPLYRTLVQDVLAADFGGFEFDGVTRPLPPLLKLDPNAAVLLDLMINTGAYPPPEQTLDEIRESVDALAVMGPPKREMTVVDRTYWGPGGELPVRVYMPDGDRVDPRSVVLYFHGGGFVAGSVNGVDNTLRALADDLDSIVVAPTYRLTPEHPFPAAVDDAYAALAWTATSASELGGSPSAVFVAGESAGGLLAAVTALRARDDNGPDIAGQILITPLIDGTADTPSRIEFANAPMLSTAAVELMWAVYLGDPANNESVLASPVRAATLAGLPPALVITVECDPLRDEGEQYAQALRAAGVQVTARRLDGLVHVSFSLSGIIPRASEATESIAEFVRHGFSSAEMTSSLAPTASSA